MKNILMAVVATATLSLPIQAALYAFQSGASLVPGNTLTGTVTYEGWDTLTNVRINNAAVNGVNPYGAHNATVAWGSTIASNLGSGSSTLFKNGGYGYIASGSLHQGASTGAVIPGGNFTITSSAVTGLETYVFLVQASANQSSVFGTFPTLTVAGTTLNAGFSSLYAVDSVSSGPGGTQALNSYAFQWDLSGLTINAGDAVTVSWTGIANSGIFQLQANQGTNFAQVVPEPSSALLGAAALGLTFIRRRRA